MAFRFEGLERVRGPDGRTADSTSGNGAEAPFYEKSRYEKSRPPDAGLR
jgi:hypothetical protein